MYNKYSSFVALLLIGQVDYTYIRFVIWHKMHGYLVYTKILHSFGSYRVGWQRELHGPQIET